MRTQAPRILLDATPIPPDRGGVGRYVDGVVPALVAAGVEITVACRPEDAPGFLAAGALVVRAPASVGRVARRLIWEQIGLPRLARRVDAEIIHSVHYTFPVFTRRRRVVTVHDLTFYSHPQVHNPGKRLFFRSWIRLNGILGNTVLAPSAATARAYVQRTGVDRDRIIVAPLGFDDKVFHPPTAEESEAFAADQSPPTSGWVAFLGTIEPRKNVPGLIQGYIAAMKERPIDRRPALFLAGSRGWDVESMPLIERAVADGFDVRTLGYLPIEQLSAFLGGAELVAYPSLGEGFGLPVLEAMAAGGCVLTTRELSLPEVGGDSVAYTATASAAIGESISSLLGRRDERDRLRQSALRRASEFTWERCAAAHVAAYETAGA